VIGMPTHVGCENCCTCTCTCCVVGVKCGCPWPCHHVNGMSELELGAIPVASPVMCVGFPGGYTLGMSGGIACIACACLSLISA
jgi:hypothetical protein